MGSKKRPFYRLVAADSRFQRDGRFLEILGHYDPKAEPYVFDVDKEKTLKWLGNGAQMSKTAEGLLRKEGIVQEFNAARQAAKAQKAESETVQDVPVASESAESENA